MNILKNKILIHIYMTNIFHIILLIFYIKSCHIAYIYTDILEVVGILRGSVIRELPIYINIY